MRNIFRTQPNNAKTSIETQLTTSYEQPLRKTVATLLPLYRSGNGRTRP